MHAKWSRLLWQPYHILAIKATSQRAKTLRALSIKHQSDTSASDRSLIHWGQDKMADIFQTTFSNVFSWMKINVYELRLKFHWSLFLRVQITIFQHWFGLSEPMMVSLLTHICVTWPQWVNQCHSEGLCYLAYHIINPYCAEFIWRKIETYLHQWFLNTEIAEVVEIIPHIINTAVQRLVMSW